MLRHKRLVDADETRIMRREMNSSPSRQQLIRSLPASSSSAGLKDEETSGQRRMRNLQSAAKQFPQDTSRRKQEAEYNREEEEDDDSDELEQRWRQAAQMLTDDDELAILTSGRRLRRRPEVASKHESKTSDVHRKRRPNSANSAASNEGRGHRFPEDDDERVILSEDEEDDDNSSISFAQSGCHSILSAWRLRANNRASRASGRRHAPARPTSVLSQASSAGKRSAASTQFTSAGASQRGKSPASHTRIPLGPRAAQHFVTNSRRRRQANELILSTLEARRRLLAMSRQQQLGGGSLFGSSSYLLPEGACSPEMGGSAAGSRPSSRQEQVAAVVAGSGRESRATPSPARDALSDLGGARRSPAAQAQRQRLMLMGAAKAKDATSGSRNKSDGSKTQDKRPPLAKIDQNSSDLYSTNSSTSGSDSSSSGSQFTQLVSGELAPDCVLLDQQALDQRRPFLPTSGKPKVPERRARAEVSGATEREAAHKPEDSRRASSRLRRGVLRRDSIRRLRMSRQASAGGGSSSGYHAPSLGSSSSGDAPSSSDSLNHSPATTTTKQNQRSAHSEQRPEVPSRRNLNFRSTSATRDVDTSGRDRLNDPVETSNIKSNKRSSWLFGSGKQSNTTLPSETINAATTNSKAPKFNILSETRRFNSSEQLRELSHRNKSSASDHKPREQQPEGVRQVERMLREMRPNQELSQSTSSTREMNETFSKKSSDSFGQQQPASVRQLTTGSANQLPPVARRPPQHPLAAATTTTSVSRQSEVNQTPISSGASRMIAADNQNQRLRNRLEESGQFNRQTTDQKPPISNRQVRREAIRSRDELRVDPEAGSRSQSRVEERWIKVEEEETGKRQLISKQQISRQQSISSERMEIIRSSSISPPFGFADPQKQPPPARPQEPPRQQQQPRQLPASSSLSPAQKPQRPEVPTRSRPAQRSEQPTASTQVKATNQPPPRHQQQQQQPSATSQSLPKFEPTADDEFRKRVDYLRKLARSNLSEPVVSSPQQTGSQLNKTNLTSSGAPKTTTTKPMSTNWQPPEAQRSSWEPRTRWHISPEPMTTSSRTQQVASGASKRPTPAPEITNLDKALGGSSSAAVESPDRNFKWRRSNSSLASVPQRPSKPKVAADVTAERLNQRISSDYPLEGRAATSGSGSHLTSTALVKLVVKEKSAPKLDYAFVERRAPQPPQQQTTSVTRRLQSDDTRSQQQQAPAKPLRVASPRSPEFGLTAGSSNDDSAIASSVSSPSLSFMMNPQAGTGNGSSGSDSSQQQPPLPALSISGQRSTLRQPQQSAGALQSILRRQQQLSSESSLDAPSPMGSHHQVPPVVRRPVLAPVRGARQSPEPSKRPELEPEPEQVSGRRSGSPFPVDAAASGQQLRLEQQEQKQDTGFSLAAASSASASSPPKRVHFNDRTSIRSFESVSSLASNSTAVPQGEIMRQQVGSPDSMGSGSTSRLSAESPDFKRSGSSGAAIYAVRGDPELELEQQVPLQPAPQMINSGPPFYQQQPAPQVSYLQRPISNQQLLPPQFAASMNPISGQSLLIQQQQQPPRGSPFLQMMAPARISTTGSGGQLPQRSPVMRPNESNSRLSDDDDSDYVQRLRQAAQSTSRVLGQMYQPAATAPSVRRPPALNAAPHNQMSVVRHLSPAQQQPRLPVQPQQTSGQQQRRVGLQAVDANLLNFQTEV